MKKIFEVILGIFLPVIFGILGVIGFLKLSKGHDSLLMNDLAILIILILLIIVFASLTIVLKKRKRIQVSLLISSFLVSSFFAFMTYQEFKKEQILVGKKTAPSKIDNLGETNSVIEAEETKHYCEKTTYNESIKELALDTTTSLEQDFVKVFGECLANNEYVEIKLSRKNIKNEKPKSVKRIDNYKVLIDSLKNGYNGLDSNTVRLVENDSIASYKLTFRDGSKTELSWSTKHHWGFYEFVSYLIDYDCFLFHEVDHGYGEILISLKDGAKLNFVPTYSPNRNRFFMINSEFGYADEYFISLKVGESPFTPEINLNTSYVPSFENEKHARIGVDNPLWINDSEFTFEFYKLIQYSSQTRNDTLYLDKINVIGKIKNTP